MEKMMNVIDRGTADLNTKESERMMNTKRLEELDPTKEDILMMEELLDFDEMEEDIDVEDREGEDSLHLNSSMRLYLTGINKYALLSPEEERRLSTIIREGGEGAAQARKTFIEANLRLVYHMAKQYCDKGVELEDLNSMGIEGLCRAVDRFDPTLGYKFSTYASWWIKQAIHRGVTNEAGIIRIPSHVKENIRKINRVVEMHKTTSEKELSVQEIAQLSGLSEEKVQKATRAMYTMASLDAPVGEEGETTMGELMADERLENPEETALNLHLREIIEQVLGQLTPKEAMVLTLRYGIGRPCPMSLEEVARLPEFKVTRERVRQIESKALHKIRRSVKLRGMLKDFAA